MERTFFTVVRFNTMRHTKWVAKAQQAIEACFFCQPQDSGTVWIWGIKRDMREFLADLGVPEKLWNEVAKRLVCPHCGASLGITTEVGLKSVGQKHLESLREKWWDEHSARFHEFYGFLEKYPYLGAHHELGRQILTQLSKLPKTEIQNERWYHARKIIDARRPSSSDMYPPDPEKVAISEGRFSHFGQRVFYMASTSDGAAREVLKANEQVAWVQEFKVVGASNVLNLIPEQGEDPSEDLSILAFAMMYGGVLTRILHEGGKVMAVRL